MDTLVQHLPPSLVGFVLTLALSLLIGFEREESRAQDADFFGGVRTFPLIALTSYLLVVAFPGSYVPCAVGLLVVGTLLAVSHWASITNESAGLTTEIAALVTYAIGASAACGLYWVSIAAGVLTVLLLQEKRLLEGLAARIPAQETSTLARFLLLTGVILPVVPNHEFTAFGINPFKLWLVVVAVNGVSYASYLLQQLWGKSRGLLLSGLLGGVYSSTVTTVALARRSKQVGAFGVRYAGAIVVATGAMYIRLWVLVYLFAPTLAGRLTLLFLPLGVCAVAVGLVLGRRKSVSHDGDNQPHTAPKTNPLEMTSAFTFAVLFLVILVVTQVVGSRFGGAGVLVMAAVMGAADVDPFILGLTQTAGSGLALETAALAVVIAAAANNIMKGVYAMIFGAREAGRWALLLLVGLAVVSLLFYWLG